MLKQRVITALVLLALLIPALLVDSPWPLAALTLALATAGGWEWARLNGVDGSGALLRGGFVAGLGLLAWWRGPNDAQGLWQGATLMWVAGGIWALRAGPAGWPRVPQPVRLIAGVLLIVITWLALMALFLRGPWFLLSVCCIVWMADIAAYFGGKALGRRKLAPTISPGKSWEGAISGAIGVLLMAVAWALVQPDANANLFAWLRAQGGWPLLIGAALALTALSVMGDLFESLVKRAAGVKDSSQLLPGHGGVLDRMDALLPVLPAAMVLLTWGAA